MSRIYLSPPHLDGDELALVTDAIESNWVAPIGPHVNAFEEEVSRRIGVGGGAALSSGTAALHLALEVLGVGRGDRVYTSTATFVASANAIRYAGATPVFLDADEATWTMDPDLLDETLERDDRAGRLPAAVVVVDLYGQCADYDRITASCRRYGVKLVEDAAESLGSTYRGRPAGSLADVAILSFNGNKIITCSSGGMLVSDDEAVVSRARFLATQARDAAPHYEHSVQGYNYRMSNVLAAIGRGQLRRLDARVEARRRNSDGYRARLAELPGITFMPLAEYGECNCWLTCILVDPGAFGADREAIRLALANQDIEARPLWKPMHRQPLFEGCESSGGKVADFLFERGLCLPSGSALTERQLGRISDVIRSVGRADR